MNLDRYGYLKDIKQWNEELAVILAEREAIILSPEHWEIVYFLREFYQEFNVSPTTRLLIKAMIRRFGIEKGNSLYLYRLFPKGLAKQAAKIAGLPKPVRCI